LCRRAAALAGFRYGLDTVLLEKSMLAPERGEATSQEPLETLVLKGLLTADQASALRRDLVGSLDTSVHDGTDISVMTPHPSAGIYLRTLGEYRILRRLGQGAMGSVYLAYDQAEDRYVAIKVLAEPLASDEKYVKRFYREANSGAMLNHPNIVRCIKAGRDLESGKHYLVLEYIEGPSAHSLIAKYGKLSVADSVRVVIDVARGLEHAHSRSLIHRDIKPDNILITPSGLAKVADLGLAKRMDEASHLTSLRQGFGSLYYIPIEQAYDAKQADERSDIYALGATLYHMVTGEVPFPGSNHIEIAEKKLDGAFRLASEFSPDVNEELDFIIQKAMARDAEKRYRLVSEMIVDLERSGLAAAVPSFADPELARTDPQIQANLQAAKPTQLAIGPLPPRPESESAAAAEPDAWYVRYRNGEGHWCKTKMTADQVRDRLRAGRISKDAEASRLPQREFRPLSDYADFSTLLTEDRTPAPSISSEPPHRHLWVGLCLIVAALTAVLALTVYWSR
jgi:serine/threonine-protein kinase